MQRLAWLPLTLLPFACSPVYSIQPVGEKPQNIATEKDEWAGTWITETGSFTIAVTDAEHGKLRVGWLEPKSDGLKLYNFDVELRAFGKWMFASFKDPDDKSGKNRYLFLRVRKHDRRIVVFHPDAAAWRSLVQRKQLPGSVKQFKSADGKRTTTEVTLSGLTAKELSFITAPERAAALFSWEDPFVLIKLAK